MVARKIPRITTSTNQATQRAPVLEKTRPGATSWTTGTGAAQPTPGGRPFPAEAAGGGLFG